MLKITKKSSPKNSAKENIALNIIGLLVVCPWLGDYHDENFDIGEVDLENDELNEVKDQILAEIEAKYDKNSQNLTDFGQKLLLLLENYDDNSYISDIIKLVKGDFVSLKNEKESQIKSKMRLLLMKNLLLELESQYKNALKIDEIAVGSASTVDDRVQEIFKQKHQIQLEILELERELT